MLSNDFFPSSDYYENMSTKIFREKYTYTRKFNIK